MGKEDQQNLKKDKVFNTDETPSQEDAWKETCNIPSAWMVKEDRQNLKKDKVSNEDETFLSGGWPEQVM